MNKLSKQERVLFGLGLIFSSVFWLGLGWLLKLTAERYLPLYGLERAGLAHLFGLILLLVIIALIAHFLYMAKQTAFLRGHAIEIGEKQLPDLHARLEAVCERLEIADAPLCYLVHHRHLARTHHIHYQGQDHLLLSSELINAFNERQGAIDFLMGYELAHMHEPMRSWRYFLWPATVLPLIGAATRRARIYRYDSAGIGACETKVDAAFALAITASGEQRWKSLNIPEFNAQSGYATQFWTALFELVSADPWLTKRMARLRAIATNSDSFIQRRHPLAFLIGMFIPYANLRSPAGLGHGALLACWFGLAIFWGILAHEQLQLHNYFGLLGQQAADPTQIKMQRLSPNTKAKKADTTANPYLRLHADLKTLGQLAMARYKLRGGIPCELGNISGVYLNYQSSRYAFSCDEPVVYTLAGRGEFEPGRPAHLHSYNWKNRQIIVGPAS